MVANVQEKPVKNFRYVIEIGNRSKISGDRWIQAWLSEKWSDRSVLKIRWKNALSEEQVCQVSNEVGENRRAFPYDGSRNVV